MLKKNKCLTDKDIQVFIDHELPSAERQEVQMHLDNCADCSAMVQDQIYWINKVKLSIRNIEVQSIGIPPMKSGLPAKKNRNTKTYLMKFLKIAAVLVVLLGSYFMLKEKEKPAYKPSAQDLMIWEENAMGNDANQIWHSRLISVTETNAKGETISVETN